MTPLLVLLHSPLVGPLTWQPTAEVLRGRGHRVLLPSLSGAVEDGPPYYPGLAEQAAAPVRAAAAAAPDAPVLLVAHSGAGALLPSVAEAVAVPVAAAVFVDALLPHPGLSWFDTVPDALRAQLRDLARDGRLPPWDRWFPPGAVEGLIPDPGLRERFLSELPSLPLGYFAEPAPTASAGWPPADRCGYLRLSDAYEDAAAEATRRGWLTVREHADHLAMVTRPELVAAALDQLVATLTGTGGR